MDWQDIGIRVAKTGAQAFLAALATSPQLGISLAQSAAVASLAAVLALLHNMAIEWLGAPAARR